VGAFAKSLYSRSPYTGADGLFLKATPIRKSIVLLDEIVERLKLPFRKEFHSTVIYSPASVDLSGDNTSVPAIPAKITEIRQWIGLNRKFYVCAILESETLSAIHNRYVALGADVSIPEFTPHITLAKSTSDWPTSQADVDIINRQLKLSPIHIVLTLGVPENIDR
jgi:hypothetical protein